MPIRPSVAHSYKQLIQLQRSPRKGGNWQPQRNRNFRELLSV
jgi:hypothetical protein